MNNALTKSDIADWAAVAKQSIRIADALGGIAIPVHTVVNGRCSCGSTHTKSPKSRGKHPVSPSWQNSTELCALDHQRILAGEFNVGCSVGERAVLLDFDGAEGVAKLDEWTERGLPLSVRCTTGSGGRHAYFTLAACWHGVFRNSASKIAPGVDVRAVGGQAVMPPSRHYSGGEYTWDDPHAEPVELPEWFVQEFMVKSQKLHVDEVDTTEGIKIKYSVNAPEDVLRVTRKIDQWEVTNSESTCLQIGYYCRDHGISEDMAVGIVLGSVWNEKCDPPWDEPELKAKLHNAYKYSSGKMGVRSVTAMYEGGDSLLPETHNHRVLRQRCGVLRGEWLADVNSAYSTLFEGSTLWVVSYVNGALRRMRPADWRLSMAGVLVEGEGKNGAAGALGDVWFKHPHTEWCAVGMYPRVKDCPPNVLNTWCGLPKSKGKAVGGVAVGCEKFKWHVRENMCAGNAGQYAWIMNWLAHMVQRPWEKPGTAIVLRSEKEGTGKGLFGEYIRRLVGDALSFKTSNPQDIVGTFNAGMDDKLLVVGDEILFKGNKPATDAIKSLITEPTVSIRRMRTDAQVRPSYVRVVLISNHDAVMDIRRGDARRITVVDMDSAKSSADWLDDVWDEMYNGGADALREELLAWDVDSKLVRRPHKGAGLDKMRTASLDRNSVEGWLTDQLLDGGALDGEACEGEGVGVTFYGDDVLLCRSGACVVGRTLYRMYADETRDQYTTQRQFILRVVQVLGGETKPVKVGGKLIRAIDFGGVERGRKMAEKMLGKGLF